VIRYGFLAAVVVDRGVDFSFTPKLSRLSLFHRQVYLRLCQWAQHPHPSHLVSPSLRSIEPVLQTCAPTLAADEVLIQILSDHQAVAFGDVMMDRLILINRPKLQRHWPESLDFGRRLKSLCDRA